MEEDGNQTMRERGQAHTGCSSKVKNGFTLSLSLNLSLLFLLLLLLCPLPVPVPALLPHWLLC